MSTSSHSYDLSLAVQARRTFLLEAHTNEELAQLVWKPTQEFLAQLAETKPEEVTCFTGQLFEFPPTSEGMCTNLYIVGSTKAIAYLGIIFSRAANLAYRVYEIIQAAPTDMAKAISILIRAPTTITRDHLVCRIPVETDDINSRDVVDEAARRYLHASAPTLAHLPITWLESSLGILLDQETWQIAKQTAPHVTNEEYERKEDEHW